MVTKTIKIYENGDSPIIWVNGVFDFDVGAFGANLAIHDEILLEGKWEWVIEGIEYNSDANGAYGLFTLQTEVE